MLAAPLTIALLPALVMHTVLSPHCPSLAMLCRIDCRPSFTLLLDSARCPSLAVLTAPLSELAAALTRPVATITVMAAFS